jgi:hypothetical protein
MWFSMLSHLTNILIRDFTAMVASRSMVVGNNTDAIGLGSDLIDKKSALISSLVRRFLRRDEPWDDDLGVYLELLTCLAHAITTILNMTFDANDAGDSVKMVGVALASLLQQEYDKLNHHMMDQLAGDDDSDDEDDDKTVLDDENGGDHDGNNDSGDNDRGISDAKRRRKDGSWM